MAIIRNELRAVFKADNKQFLTAVRGTKKAIGALVGATVAIGSGMAVGATLAVKRFMEFEKAMSEVNTIAKLNKQDFEKLKKEVLNLSASFGQSKEALTKGLYDSLSAGVPANNAISFLTDATKLAIAGATDTATAVDLLTGVLNAYGMSATEAGNISDQLFKTVELGKTTIPELAGALGTVAPIASQLGVETDQLLASFATLTTQSIKTDEAATAIRGTLSSLLSPSKQLEKQLKQTFGTSNAQVILKTEKLQDVLVKLADAVDNDSTRIAELFPNVRALNGVMSMTGNKAKLAERGLTEVGRATGATDKAISEFTDDASFAFAKLTAQLDSEVIKIGEMLANELKGPMSDFVAFLQEPATQQAIAAFSKGLVGAITTVAEALRDLVNLYKAMREAAAEVSPEQQAADVERGRQLGGLTTSQLKSERLKERAKMVAWSALPGVGVKNALEARINVQMLDEMIKQREQLEMIRKNLPSQAGAQ